MLLAASLVAVAGGWTAGGWTAGGASRAFPFAPPPGHTGGFGEPTCEACHFGEAPDDPRGELTLEGVPERYTPGELYELTVRLRHPDLAAAGFQLAPRTSEGAGGTAAGTLAPLDERTAVVAKDSVTYLSQTADGAVARDSASWRVTWNAPDSAGASVIFHLSGNAANGDESQFGDRIYSLERRSKSP